MQFTQINQISSFLNPSFYQNTASNYTFTTDQWIKEISSDQILREPLFHEVMKNLDQLNIQQPFAKRQESFDGNNSSTKNEQQCVNQISKQEQQKQINKKYDRSKSTIFRSTLSNIRSISEINTDLKYIKVFYFCSPVMKVIPYSKKTTIKDLIQKSIDIYLQQNYDTNKAHQPIQSNLSIYSKEFQMRLPASENQFTPDLNIQPIHLERIVSQNLFQTLILVQKPKKQDFYHTQRTKQYSLEDSSMSCNTSVYSQMGLSQIVRFTLMDETYYQLMQIQLQKQGNLQKLFKVIKQTGINNLKQFVIKEDPESQFQLNPDHQVKQIQKNRLYIMAKTYMDQAQDDMNIGPIRLKTLIQSEINYLPPIGINQASRYQEFQVTKISSLGIAIQRILGIDQTKIYNYEKQLRQNKRQASFVDKFLGFNKQTGTKRPYKFVKDIKEIKKFQGGVQLVFPQKITTYIIKDQSILEQVYRKLNFLVQWHRNNGLNRNESMSSFSSSKKNQSFFKF